MSYENRLFEEIKSVLPNLDDLRKNGSINFKSMDEKILIGKLFKELVPTAQISLSCDSCTIYYLNHLLSFYEREYPKHINFLQKQTKESEVLQVKTPELIESNSKEEAKVLKPKKRNKNAKGK